MIAAAIPQALVEIRLHGHLRARFGKSYRLAVNSAAEAVRALCTVLPGFRQYLAEHSAPGYRVWYGDAPAAESRELHYPCGKMVRIVPAIAGAKRGGLGQIFLGAALIGLSFIPGLNVAIFSGFSMTFASLAMNVGISMLLGGISQMLAGNPEAPTPSERPNNQPSYAFNGAVNTTGQGNPVPVLYGRLRIGSQVISAGLSTSQIGSGTPSMSITWPIVKA